MHDTIAPEHGVPWQIGQLCYVPDRQLHEHDDPPYRSATVTRVMVCLGGVTLIGTSQDGDDEWRAVWGVRRPATTRFDPTPAPTPTT